MVHYKGNIMLGAPALIGRSMTYYWAGVSGKGNIIFPRWQPNKKRKGYLSPLSKTNIYHLPPSDPPCFSLVTTFNYRNLGTPQFSIGFPVE
jgi:hypothetical protein